MKVICISNNNKPQICTIGQVYEAIDTGLFIHKNEPYYIVKDNRGKIIKTSIHNFKPLRESNLDYLLNPQNK